MNLLEQLAIKYGTDKRIDGGHGYTKHYSEYFDSIRLNKLNILELGIREGASIKVWHEYFENSTIYGIDNNAEGLCPNKFEEERIVFRFGNQDDRQFLTNLAKEAQGFDIVIDDCSHISDLTISSFEILWPHLKSGGIYIIEDLHCCRVAPTYLRFGPPTIDYINSLDKNVYQIKHAKLFNDKIYFLQKAV